MCNVGPPFVTRINISGKGSVLNELIGLMIDRFVTCPVGACHQTSKCNLSWRLCSAKWGERAAIHDQEKEGFGHPSRVTGTCGSTHDRKIGENSLIVHACLQTMPPINSTCLTSKLDIIVLSKQGFCHRRWHFLVKEGEIDEARGGRESRDKDVGEKEGGAKREGKEARTGRVLKQGQRRS
jgi:hypothetical protein